MQISIICITKINCINGRIDRYGRPIRTNSGKNYRFGLELDADLQLGQMWRIIPNVTFSENKNIDFVTSKDGELAKLRKNEHFLFAFHRCRKHLVVYAYGKFGVGLIVQVCRRTIYGKYRQSEIQT